MDHTVCCTSRGRKATTSCLFKIGQINIENDATGPSRNLTFGLSFSASLLFPAPRLSLAISTQLISYSQQDTMLALRYLAIFCLCITSVFCTSFNQDDWGGLLKNIATAGRTNTKFDHLLQNIAKLENDLAATRLELENTREQLTTVQSICKPSRVIGSGYWEYVRNFSSAVKIYDCFASGEEIAACTGLTIAQGMSTPIVSRPVLMTLSRIEICHSSADNSGQ